MQTNVLTVRTEVAILSNVVGSVMIGVFTYNTFSSVLFYFIGRQFQVTLVSSYPSTALDLWYWDSTDTWKVCMLPSS